MKYKVTNISDRQKIVRNGGSLAYLNPKESITLDKRPEIDDDKIFKIEEVKKNVN